MTDMISYDMIDKLLTQECSYMLNIPTPID